MAIPSPNVIVYTENLLLTGSSKAPVRKWIESQPDLKKERLEDWEKALDPGEAARAGFDTVIVGSFHAHEDGSIFYNKFPLDSDIREYLLEGTKILKTCPGSTVKKVLLSFGGGFSVSDLDYSNMKANWESFKPALIDLVKYCGADGVDWDYEPVETTFDTEFITRITKEIAAAHFLVTAAPFDDPEGWKTVIGGTIRYYGKIPIGNLFAWWNVQQYSDYRSWVPPFENAVTGMSRKTLGAFMVSGYAPDSCSDLPYNDLKELLESFPYLNGAFIWNYTAIKDCAPSAVSSEIRKILTKNPEGEA